MGDHMKLFKVLSELEIKGCKAVILDNKLSHEEYKNRHIVFEGEKYSYVLTHNDYQIVVKSDKSLLGKEIYFTP